jgi:hypothetical protein
MNAHRYGAATLAALTLALSAAHARAAPAIDLTAPGDEFNGATLTLGFQFTVDSPQLVTALGVFDDAADGLLWDSPVGLWDSQGQLLTSAVVPKGAGARLDGLFRYVDIDPLRLAAGESYVIGAYNTGDFAASLGEGLGGAGAINPHVRIEEDRFANSGHFELPTLTSGNAGAWLGGNLELSAAPEPGSWSLMITGVGLAGAVLRRRQGAARA